MSHSANSKPNPPRPLISANRIKDYGYNNHNNFNNNGNNITNDSNNYDDFDINKASRKKTRFNRLEKPPPLTGFVRPTNSSLNLSGKDNSRSGSSNNNDALTPLLPNPLPPVPQIDANTTVGAAKAAATAAAAAFSTAKSNYRRSRLLLSRLREHISEIFETVGAHISSLASPVFGTNAKNAEKFHKKMPKTSERFRTYPNVSECIQAGPNKS